MLRTIKEVLQHFSSVSVNWLLVNGGAPYLLLLVYYAQTGESEFQQAIFLSSYFSRCVPITGDHSKQDLTVQKKPIYFPILTNNIWSYLLWSPVIDHRRREFHPVSIVCCSIYKNVAAYCQFFLGDSEDLQLPNCSIKEKKSGAHPLLENRSTRPKSVRKVWPPNVQTPLPPRGTGCMWVQFRDGCPSGQEAQSVINPVRHIC